MEEMIEKVERDDEEVEEKEEEELKRRAGASNGQRYPLPCCTHFLILFAPKKTDNDVEIQWTPAPTAPPITKIRL